MRGRLLIIGGSYSASELALSARQNGYGEEILVLSEEAELPYQRPPLSKTFLKAPSDEAMALRSPAFYAGKDIKFELGAKVVSLDGARHCAVLSTGSKISYDTLALTTGARARKLSCPGADLDNVYTLRSVADARLLKVAAARAENVVVIGAGFIGLEVASALAQLGKNVTVVEIESRVLARVASPEISAYLSTVHAAHGVTIKLSSAVHSLAGNNGLVRKVLLADGSAIDVDIVLVGIGSIPNLELIEPFGVPTASGVVVDAHARTSVANVFAAGDCTQFRGPFNPAGIRLESVQNATDQARAAGAAIAGVDSPYHALPWFWSDQYDQKLQIAGLAQGAAERVVRADGPGVAVFHFRDDSCVCVETVNRPRDHLAARKLLTAGKVTRDDLQQVDFETHALAKALAANPV